MAAITCPVAPLSLTLARLSSRSCAIERACFCDVSIDSMKLRCAGFEPSLRTALMRLRSLSRIFCTWVSGPGVDVSTSFNATGESTQFFSHFHPFFLLSLQLCSPPHLTSPSNHSSHSL